MAASLSVERSSSCGGGGGVFCRFVLFSSFIDPVRCADDQSSAVLWAGVFSLLEPSHSLDRSNVQGLRPLLGCIKCSVPRRFTPSQSRSFTVTFPNSSAPQCVWSVCFTLYIRCCLSFAFVLLVLSVSACAETSLTPSWGLLLERRPSQPSFFFLSLPSPIRFVRIAHVVQSCFGFDRFSSRLGLHRRCVLRLVCSTRSARFATYHIHRLSTCLSHMRGLRLLSPRATP